MRIPSRWFTRRAQHLFLSNSLGFALTQRTTHHARSRLALPSCLPSLLQTCHASSVTQRASRDETAESNITAPVSESLSPPATVASGEAKDIPKLSGWMVRLNRQLPAELRIQQDSSPLPSPTQPASKPKARGLETIFKDAKTHEGTEVLLWLVENGYRKTAVWLMELILDFSSSKKENPALKPPSNIDWPIGLFDSVREMPLDEPVTYRPSTEALGSESQVVSVQVAQAEGRLLTLVWETLGTLIINSAHSATDDNMDDNMLTALLVLAHVHNSGLMPDNVYTYTHLNHATHAQRPPILNLVSSRILAALSDVKWRQQQDDAISQAARTGMSLKEISKNVPGGRFRLKVRPLAPEIWLELILWCCIESAELTPALAIIAKLAAQVEEPWFATRWTSPQSREKVSTLIDWDRVKLRHGGPAGLMEGYSREKPFVDVPDKTISVEVVLALIEKLFASTLSPSLSKANRRNIYRTSKGFRTLRTTMSDIQDVMTFLEPHDLDPGYFDYLESRLLQDGAFDLTRAPVDLYTWTGRMRSIRDLKAVNPERQSEQKLDLSEIQAQSQLHIGMQHQALGTLVEFGDIHNTLAVFNEIQENIDENKVASITTFLQQQQSATTKAIPTPFLSHDLEFTNCHGQLPYYKLAGLLNLVSDTGLIGLGRWMLYTQEVDGAVLPEQVWGLPCMTSALYKFAAISQDEDLFETALAKRPPRLLSSVKMLRTLADTNMKLLRLQHAVKNLENLRAAKGGGFGLSNVANIAATILRLEQRNPKEVENLLRQAICILEDIIVHGRYSSVRSDFTLEARQLFKRQIHHLLMIFLSFRGSILERFAYRHAAKFPYSNLALLPAKDFNVLLSAGIDAYGAKFGRSMWDRMCKTPDNQYAAELVDMDVESLQDLDAVDDSKEPDLLSESGSSRSFGIPLNQISANDRQKGHSSDDEELLQFDDPFFPTTSPGTVNNLQVTPWEEENDVSVPVDTDETPLTRTDDRQAPPLVIPNMNTLRLITRAAARRLKSREERGLTTYSQRQQLAWSVQMFEAFGVTDPTVVEQEVQLPPKELDKEIQAANEAIETDNQYSRLAPIEQDLSIGSPVSEMWLPLK